MDDRTFDRWVDRRLAGVEKPRQAAALIAVVTSLITVVAGLLITLTDPQSFPSVGLGLWWGVQTVTTVGYGDYVPKTVAGRTVAALVMLGGIGFVSVLTAAITSGFVARTQRRLDRQDPPASAEVLQEILASLHRLETRMDDRA